MKKIWIVGMLVVVLLVGGYGVFRSVSTAGALGPTEVVKHFYEWYLGYVGDRSADEMRNPLVDAAYRTSPHLSPQLVAQVDELVAGFDQGGFDPFLLAQDIPAEVKAGPATITGGYATVPVTTSFPGHAFTVTLERRPSGDWLITSIRPGR